MMLVFIEDFQYTHYVKTLRYQKSGTKKKEKRTFFELSVAVWGRSRKKNFNFVLLFL